MIPIKPGASLAALPDDQAERAARVASLSEDTLGSRDPSMIAEVCAILIARARLRRLDLPPETMRMAEEAAAVYSRAMPELTRGAILSTVRRSSRSLGRMPRLSTRCRISCECSNLTFSPAAGAGRACRACLTCSRPSA